VHSFEIEQYILQTVQTDRSHTATNRHQPTEAKWISTLSATIQKYYGI